MTPEYAQEIAANLERAEQSIQAAKELAAKGYHDFAASRAYYAAFYAATAVLLNEGLDFSKHSPTRGYHICTRRTATVHHAQELCTKYGVCGPGTPFVRRVRLLCGTHGVCTPATASVRRVQTR